MCAVTGYRRDYARLRLALTPREVKLRIPGPPKYGGKVVAALEKCWAVANAPAGKRLAPLLKELVPVLRCYQELDIDGDAAALLVSMRPTCWSFLPMGWASSCDPTRCAQPPRKRPPPQPTSWSAGCPALHS